MPEEINKGTESFSCPAGRVLVLTQVSWRQRPRRCSGKGNGCAAGIGRKPKKENPGLNPVADQIFTVALSLSLGSASKSALKNASF